MFPLSDEILQSSENDKEHAYTRVHTYIHTQTLHPHARTARVSATATRDYTQTLLVMIPVLRVHVRTVCPCYPSKTTSYDKLNRSIVRQILLFCRSTNRYFNFHRLLGRSRIEKRQVNKRFFNDCATRSSLILRPIVPTTI